MPQHTNRISTLHWLALFAIVITALIWRPQTPARADDIGVNAGEYAIVTFRTQDAIVFTNEGSYFMEGPEIRNRERVVGDTNLRLVRPIEVEHLTSLGMQGWEVIHPWGDGSWLLRRER